LTFPPSFAGRATEASRKRCIPALLCNALNKTDQQVTA
jgi:hypothetical protein